MSILANTIDVFGRIAFWRRRKAKQGGVRTTVAQVPARLSPADQWERLSDVVSGAIASAKSARDLQAGAAQQLDLATYALYTLFDDLTSVMSEPLVREAAVVHRLQPKGQRQRSAALAA